MNFLKVLNSRFLLKDSISVTESYAGQGIYCGFDPTAASLHLGHLCALNSLVHASGLGYTPIAVIGTATALIGDPSGKTESRPMMDQKTLSSNAVSLTRQISSIYTNLCKRSQKPYRQLQIIENHHFYKDLSLLRFLQEIGFYFPVNPLMNRDFVQSRNDGVSYTEFSYGLLQAYDFYTLFENHNCIGQIGGSDQWSNITAGTELIRKKTGKPSFGCTLPLLTTKDGKKFGKTEGNALFMDKTKTKSYDIYQYCYNLPDSDIEHLLYRLTFLSEERISSALAEPLEQRAGQRLLALEIIETLHGAEEAASVSRLSEILFTQDYSKIISDDLEQLSNFGNKVYVYTNNLQQDLVEFLKESGICPSKKEARRLIENKSIKINGTLCSVDKRLQDFERIAGVVFIVNVGKKKVYMIYVKD